MGCRTALDGDDVAMLLSKKSTPCSRTNGEGTHSCLRSLFQLLQSSTSNVHLRSVALERPSQHQPDTTATYESSISIRITTFLEISDALTSSNYSHQTGDIGQTLSAVLGSH